MRRRSTLLISLMLIAFGAAAQPAVRKHVIGKRSAGPVVRFAHVTDTHIGEAAPGGDFGTEGFLNDTLTGNEQGYAIDRLRAVVRHINGIPVEAAPQFVIVSGDLTDSGERSEFMMARQLLDSLSIPYIPHIGNHDAWPYNRFGTEAPTACGDSLINEVFAGTYGGLAQRFAWDDGTRTARVTDGRSGNAAYFQNFSFVEKGVRFVFLDFNPRYHVRKDEPGIGPEAFVDTAAGRALHFLEGQLLLSEGNDEQVVIVAHHPPVWSVIGRFAFSAGDKTVLAKVIRPHRRRVVGWFCGHLHRWARYRFTKAGIRVFETKASKDRGDGALRIVEVHSR